MKKKRNDKNSFLVQLDNVMQLARARKEALDRLVTALTEKETPKETDKPNPNKSNKNKRHKTVIL